MSDKFIQAQAVYQTVCEALDARNWKYAKDEESLSVQFGVNGESLAMQFLILSDASRQLVRVFVKLPFQMPEEKRLEGAVAASAATFGMVDGNFVYNISTGTISFRMTASFRESTIGVNLIQYLIECSCAMVDKYSGKFLALSKGMVELDEFLKKD